MYTIARRCYSHEVRPIRMESRRTQKIAPPSDVDLMTKRNRTSKAVTRSSNFGCRLGGALINSSHENVHPSEFEIHISDVVRNMCRSVFSTQQQTSWSVVLELHFLEQHIAGLHVAAAATEHKHTQNIIVYTTDANSYCIVTRGWWRWEDCML